MSDYPKWATPYRRAHLVKIFYRSRGFCVFGHYQCPIPEHHYHSYIDGLIADWKYDDRSQRLAEWQAERQQLHRTADRRYPQHGQFSAVSRDIFFANQPLYYLQGLGISGLTFKPFAKIRIPSSSTILHVDLGNTLKGLSKSKRRKVVRYGKPLPTNIQDAIADRCKKAVRRYLGSN